MRRPALRRYKTSKNGAKGVEMGLEACCPALAVLLGWVGYRANHGTAGRRGGTKVIRLARNGPRVEGIGAGAPRAERRPS